jgi:hypothetical protein
VLPVAESSNTKYDQFLTQLMAPSAMALLLTWEPQLKQLFFVYSQDADELAAQIAAGNPLPAGEQ